MKRGTKGEGTNGENGEGEEMKYRKPVVTPLANIDPGGAQKRKTSGTLTPDILEKLGKQLSGYYGGLIEPIPDRFAKILRELDKPGNLDKPSKKDSSE
jgi:hypothetical protein